MGEAAIARLRAVSRSRRLRWGAGCVDSVWATAQTTSAGWLAHAGVFDELDRIGAGVDASTSRPQRRALDASRGTYGRAVQLQPVREGESRAAAVRRRRPCRRRPQRRAEVG